MTKSTPDVSTCFVFKSSLKAFISPLFFTNSFTLRGGGGNARLPDIPSFSGVMFPHIIWLALRILPSYAPVRHKNMEQKFDIGINMHDLGICATFSNDLGTIATL